MSLEANGDLKQFERQQFINLETFKRSGQGVKTPVWFVENEGRLYVRTMASSWKVKRIRNHAGVRVVPCMAQGEPLGEWLPARARIIAEPALESQVNQWLDQKYGLQKKMFDAMGKLRKTRYAAIEIEI